MKTRLIACSLVTLSLCFASCKPSPTLEEQKTVVTAGVSLIEVKANQVIVPIKDGQIELPVGKVVLEIELKGKDKPGMIMFKHLAIREGRVVNHQSGSVDPTSIKVVGDSVKFSFETDVPKDTSKSMIRLKDAGLGTLFELMITAKP